MFSLEDSKIYVWYFITVVLIGVENNYEEGRRFEFGKKYIVTKVMIMMWMLHTFPFVEKDQWLFNKLYCNQAKVYKPM